MSRYEPRDGDEITVSLRGTVREDKSFPGWSIEAANTINLFEDLEDFTVEVHKRGPKPKPKLPTTPGSVIRSLAGSDRSHDGGLRVLQHDGRFHCYAKETDYSPAIYRSGSFEIVFDAGAAR